MKQLLIKTSLNIISKKQNTSSEKLNKQSIALEFRKCMYVLDIIPITPLATSQEKDTIQGSPTDVQGLARPVTWLYIIPH